jgi:hypothetical protein
VTAAWVALVVVLAVAVFAVAAIAIGREARRLDTLAPRAVYVLDEAVDFVAERLPPLSQAQLTHDEVRALLLAHMQWLYAKGLQPDDVVDRPQDMTDHPIVVEDTTLVGYLIGAGEQAGLVLDDVDVAHVVEAHLAYFEAIGAVGPEAADPDVPMRQLGRGSGGELGSGRDGNGDGAANGPADR